MSSSKAMLSPRNKTNAGLNSSKSRVNKWATEASNWCRTPGAKILTSRALVALSLATAAAIIGWINYTTFTRQEKNFAVDQYNAISAQGLTAMVTSFTRMNRGVQMLAKAYSYANQDINEWPYVKLDGFSDLATQLGEMASLDNAIFAPLVTPDQRSDYHDFVRQVWATDPVTRNISTQLPGYWLGPFRWGPNGSPVPDMNGTEEFPTTNNNILVPATQMTFSADLPPLFLGLNVHSLPLFIVALDWAIDCVKGLTTFEEAFENCGYFSSTAYLPAPTPADPDPVTQNVQSFAVYPIVVFDPALGKVRATGIASGAVNWATLLSRAVPSYVEGLDCVVTTSTGKFTYSIEGGLAVFKGLEDMHDTNYDEYGKTTDLLEETPGVFSFSKYQLTFYPRRAFFRTYTTDAPFVTTAVMISSIILCCIVFGVYDWLISRESTRKQLVLDTKRRFVRFISHEIRTPLNTVRLGLKLLEMEFEGLKKQLNNSHQGAVVTLVKDYLTSWTQLADDILGNSDSAVDVLNDLLNYDKIEMGTLRLEFSSVAICALIKKTAASFVMQAKQKSIELALVGDCWNENSKGEPEEDVYDQLRVVGDSTRIAQVLRNLISNALKFTSEHGTVTITVSWRDGALPDAHLKLAVPADQAALLDDPRAGSLQVAVKDSGAGLSPEQLAEICAEGVQFNANQLQAGQGSGLGLFISKGLVEQHGGTLRVSSEGLGRGSTFTIELPVFRAEADIVPTRRRSGEARQKERRSSKSSGAGSSRLQATQDGNHLTDDLFCIPESVLDLAENTEIIRRVLVVDDADSNRKLVMRILAAKGYLCTGAANGQEAVDAYAQLKQQGDHVDAVMMDYEMPIMDGPTACKKLREMGCTCFIAGVTGNVLPADVDHFKHMGASAVLSKPLNVDVFESLYHSFTAPAPPLATNATRSLSEARTIELMVASTSNGGSDGSMNNHLHGLDIV